MIIWSLKVIKVDEGTGKLSLVPGLSSQGYGTVVVIVPHESCGCQWPLYLVTITAVDLLMFSGKCDNRRDARPLCTLSKTMPRYKCLSLSHCVQKERKKMDLALF